MKKILSLAGMAILSISIFGQSLPGKGKPIMQIITDFHLNLNDTAKTTGFGLSRAYFGYNYQADENFSCEILLNIGTPEDLPKPATARRYAFFREASVMYKHDNLHVSFGIITTRHFDLLQKFWGKRFINNEFEVRNKYGNIADLGVVVDYLASEKVSFDLAITNGEGYNEIQLDNGLKAGAGITFKPDQRYVIRFYNDLNRNKGIMQYTASGFAGIDNRLVNFGVSAHYKTNWDFISGHDVWGVSSTGAIKLPNSFEIFARYDYSGSVILSGESSPWNRTKDASLAIVGIQKNISENCRIALDFQDTIPYGQGLPTSAFIFINALFRI
jgi:hypothetical protein